MTPLRERMTEDMQLAGYSSKTQQAYVGAVRQLFAHFNCTREYFLYLANERKVSRPTATIALCGIKFFYQRTLQRDCTTLGLVRPRPEKKLPVVLSREEVRRILEQVHTPVYRACLKTIYSCGLRLREGSHLQTSSGNLHRLRPHLAVRHCRSVSASLISRKRLSRKTPIPSSYRAYTPLARRRRPRPHNSTAFSARCFLACVETPYPKIVLGFSSTQDFAAAKILARQESLIC